MRKICLLAFLLEFGVVYPAGAQQPSPSKPQWQSSKKQDLSSGTRNIQFTLAGKFVTAPKSGSSDHPTLVVTCNPDKRARGLLGKYVSASLDTGASVKIDYVEPQEIKEGISYCRKVII